MKFNNNPETSTTNTRVRSTPDLPLNEPILDTGAATSMPPSKSVNGRQCAGPMYKRAPARSPSETREHWNRVAPVDPVESVVMKKVKPAAKEIPGANAVEPEPKPVEKDADVDDAGLNKVDKASREVFRAPVEAEKIKIIADFEADGLDPPLDLEERAMKKIHGHTAFNTDRLYPGPIHSGFEATSDQHYEFKRHLPKDMEDDLHQEMLRGRIRTKHPAGEENDLITGDEVWAEQEVLELERVGMGLDEKDRAAEENAEDEAEEERTRESKRLAASGHLAGERRKLLAKEARVDGRDKRDMKRADARKKAECGQNSDGDLFGEMYDDDEDDNTPPEPTLVNDSVQKDIHQRFFVNAPPPSTLNDQFHKVYTAYGADAVGELLKRLESTDDNTKILNCELADSVSATAFVGCMTEASKAEIEYLILPKREDKQRLLATDASLLQGSEECSEFLDKEYALDPYNMACMAIFYDDASFVAVITGTEHGRVDDEGKLYQGCQVDPIDFGAEVLRLRHYAQSFVGEEGYVKTDIDPVERLQDLSQVIAETGLRPEVPDGLPISVSEEVAAATDEDEPQDELGAAIWAELKSHDSGDDGETTSASTITSKQQSNKSGKRNADEADLDSEETARGTQPDSKKMKPTPKLALPKMSKATPAHAPASTYQKGNYSEQEIAGLARNVDRSSEKVESLIGPVKRGRGETPDDLARFYPGDGIQKGPQAKKPKVMMAPGMSKNGIKMTVEDKRKGKAKAKTNVNGNYQSPAAADTDEDGSEIIDPSEHTLPASNAAPRSKSTQTPKHEPQLTATGRVSKKGQGRGKCLACNSSYYVTDKNTSTQCSQKKCPGHSQLLADRAAKKAAAKLAAKPKSKKRGAADDIDDEVPRDEEAAERHCGPRPITHGREGYAACPRWCAGCSVRGSAV